MRSFGSLAVAVLVSLWTPAAAGAQGSAADLYKRALAQEQVLRSRTANAALEDLRSVVRAYERVVLRHPRSGYCDNALWQAAAVSLLAYGRFGEASDRRNGERLLRLLRTEYPSSSFISRIDGQLKRFIAVSTGAATTRPARPLPAGLAPQAAPKSGRPLSAGRTATIRQIARQALPPGMRVTVELDGEVEYQESRLADPPRLVLDFKRTQVSPSLNKQPLTGTDEVIRAIRIGQRPDSTARVVIELAFEARHTTIALYDPFRLVIDFERPRRHEIAAQVTPVSSSPPMSASVPRPESAPPPVAVTAESPPPPPPPIASEPAMPPALPAPVAPRRNSDGSFSLARQLGLGVSRIVIDPGHGGHDPGAQAHRQREAELVLDIGLRLEALLLKEAGVDVVLTRRTDVFIPLEERTAIANRAGADLFLSIHANASRNQRATGVETYYLNFATNREAEEVAARENSASGKTMHNLPDIVQAIALNNKLDESKDFASLVQDAMIRRLKPQYKALRNLGVKQAPFVVLIGAQMPSVLAEVSFITNKTDASLLGKAAFRQRIAQALFDATMRYQQTLKTTVTVAQRPVPGALRD